ncbi:PREDICTED: probable zinc transporter protein DDB_G0282067 isoform X4 [Branchiostoma belcheri]|uniref:Probable zinc transporter protein DDB_G0282067 isoform X4 n=1 Tax=Branchiostoma belcheri TaxID=7741 RepID=A0A6P4Z640_BRABE|nr:PREDICTED: probable zinc transporter protein DDB_G0282067 isoform X4 [Branchiostoma belcheri]
MGYKLAMFLGLTGLLMVLVVDQADAIRQKRMVPQEASALLDLLTYLADDLTMVQRGEGSDEEHYEGDGHDHLLRQEEEESHEHGSDEEHYAGDGHGHGSSVEDRLLRQEEEEESHEHDSDEEHYAGDGHGHGSSVEDRLLRQEEEESHEHGSDEEHYAGDGHGHGSSVEDRLLRQEEEESHEHGSDEEHYAGDGHGHGSSVEDLERELLEEARGLLELLRGGRKRRGEGSNSSLEDF